MGIKIRRGYREDFDEWDHFLIRSKMDHVLQSSVMGEVWNHISFQPLLIVAEEKNDIVGGLMSHIWFGNSRLFPVYRSFSIFRSQYGPIIANAGKRSFLLQRILEFVHKEVRTQKLMQHIISTHYTWGDCVFRELGYRPPSYALRTTFIVNLQKSKVSLRKSIKKKTRYGIRKAEQYGVETVEGSNEETPKLFYYLHAKTARRLAIMPDPYSFVEGIWKILVPKGYAKFLFAYYDGKPIASTLFLIFNKKLYVYMSSSLKEFWRVYPNNLLKWRILEYGLEHGFDSCDLMGAPGPEEKNHPEYGLHIFKRGWGGRMVGIRFYERVFSPKALWMWKSLAAAACRLPSFTDLVSKRM